MKTGKRGLNPLIWRPAAVNNTLLIVLLCSNTCDTAVKRYIITTAAAVLTESDHTKSHKITKSLKRKKILWVVV